MKHSFLIISLSVIYLTLVVPMFTFAEDTAGKTIVARGQVNAKNLQQSRKLIRRSPVYLLDTVATGSNSNTQLRMIDGGLLSLQQQTQLIVAAYQFDQETNEGSVSLNLLKGGLRTVTGALKTGVDQYKMQTPVASIGVRGTHYEAELVQGSLYLSVWDGAIDVQVTVGSKPMKFSLGEHEDYKFAIVHANGEVEFTLKVPKVFSQGHSLAMLSEPLLNVAQTSKQEQLIKEEYPQRYLSNTDESISNEEFDQTGKILFDNDDIWGSLIPTSPDVITQLSGTVTFDQILEQSIVSNSGAITDLSMNMTVNFDTARVPTGQLSFNDTNGQWFAVFNGIINADALEININFASYNNNLVDGSINGLFLNNGSQIFGDFSLTQINNPVNNAGGSFLLVESP